MLIKDLQSIPEYGTIRMIVLYENSIFRALYQERVAYFVSGISRVSSQPNPKHEKPNTLSHRFRLALFVNGHRRTGLAEHDALGKRLE